jgi:hypothetical protein
MGNRNNMLLYRAFISPQTNPQASLTFPEIVALRASETASWGCSQPAPLFPIHSLPASRHPESRYGSHPGGGRGGKFPFSNSRNEAVPHIAEKQKVCFRPEAAIGRGQFTTGHLHCAQLEAPGGGICLAGPLGTAN